MGKCFSASGAGAAFVNIGLTAPSGCVEDTKSSFGKIKAPAGVLKTQNALFEENKSPCGHVKYTDGVFEENKSPCGHVRSVSLGSGWGFLTIPCLFSKNTLS